MTVIQQRQYVFHQWMQLARAFRIAFGVSLLFVLGASWPIQSPAQNPQVAHLVQKFPFKLPVWGPLDYGVENPMVEAISPTLSIGRSSLGIQAALKPIAERITPSVVQLVGDFDQVSLGTIVSTDGLIIAKHSLLSESIHCLMPDGKEYAGRLIGIHLQNDLALIQINANDLKPIVFAKTVPVEPGKFVASIGYQESIVGFGLVTVPPQTFVVRQLECKDCIDLGVTVAEFPIRQQIQEEFSSKLVSGLEVERVYPRTASENTGLLVGDLIQTMNGFDLTSRSQLDAIGKTIKIGQTLTFGVYRDGQPKKLSSQVKSFAPRTLHDRWGGGPFSERRFGFDRVIAHDSVVEPDECGGPLVDLKGNVIGINVARSMRVATFAIPIDDVYKFVKFVRPNVQLHVDKSSPMQTR